MKHKITLKDFEKLEKFEFPANPLKVARIAKGYTQSDVANVLGLSVRQYQRYENGEKEIAEAPFQLGVNMCEILDIDIFDVISSIKSFQDSESDLPGVYEPE